MLSAGSVSIMEIPVKRRGVALITIALLLLLDLGRWINARVIASSPASHQQGQKTPANQEAHLAKPLKTPPIVRFASPDR
jgi:hypothetical protein